MKLPSRLWIAVIAIASIVGCGGSSRQTADTGTTTPPSTATPAQDTASTAIPERSPYDVGQRAAESPADPAAAIRGEKLFTAKGCATCHGFGRKVLCPDLNGVTRQRTAEWMRNQILHPEVMTRTDPIAHQLLVETKLQMTNQHLTAPEANDVIEFLKAHDRAGH